jgi:diadenosine tetraphosphate (Ap4A) HIT family hydrolase
MSYDPGNVFAKILKGEIPCKKIYENAFALSFYDINPKAPLHALVIPKGAYESFHVFVSQAPQEEVAGFFKAVDEVLTLLDLKDSQGYRVIINNGPYAGMEVPHFHLHILAGKPLGPMLSV